MVDQRPHLLQRLDPVIAVDQDLAALFRAFGVAPSRVRVIVPYSRRSAR